MIKRLILAVCLLAGVVSITGCHANMHGKHGHGVDVDAG